MQHGTRVAIAVLQTRSTPQTIEFGGFFGAVRAQPQRNNAARQSYVLRVTEICHFSHGRGKICLSRITSYQLVVQQKEAQFWVGMEELYHMNTKSS